MEIVEDFGVPWHTIKNIVWTCVVAGVVMFLINMRREKKRLVGYVSGLRTFPVKSCRGVQLDSTEIGQLGLLHDR